MFCVHEFLRDTSARSFQGDSRNQMKIAHIFTGDTADPNCLAAGQGIQNFPPVELQSHAYRAAVVQMLGCTATKHNLADNTKIQIVKERDNRCKLGSFRTAVTSLSCNGEPVSGCKSNKAPSTCGKWKSILPPPSPPPPPPIH